MMTCWRKIRIFLAVASVPVSWAFADAQLQIQPVRLQIDAGRAASLTLINQSDSNAVFEASAYEWGQNRDGTDVLVPTKDLIVTPPIMRIAPGSPQTLRVALQPSAMLPEGVERTFRIQLEEIPSPEIKSGVSFRLKYLLPVFVGAGEPEAGPVELHLSGDADTCLVSAENLGTRHLQLQRITALAGAETYNVDAPLYLLAGTRIVLPCPQGKVRQGQLEGIRLESDEGVFTDAGSAGSASGP